ncbi:MAG TPA: nuclear transport factor 2 family protein [Cryomorphaceae bacterium]|nr:nuclear transport factor 2 family protein [Cryomorphaceae bacterium]
MNSRILGGLALVTILSTSCGNIESHSDSESELRTAMSEQQNAWNRGDIEGFMAFYDRSKDLTFSNSTGITKGFDTVLNRYKNTYPTKEDMGTLGFELKEFHNLGPDHVLVLGAWELSREPDNPKGTFSLVWEYTPNGWKIIHDHTS